ncbi:MAG: L,D-transpeptidase [Candidatus Pacearchaeota archaeon]
MKSLINSLINLFLASILITNPWKCDSKKTVQKFKFDSQKKIELSYDSLNLWKRWIQETIRKSESLKCPAIIVSKLDRRLELYLDGKRDTSFNIFLFDYFHPKTRQGDGCTPEGMFYVTTKAKHPYFEYVLQISYPDTSAAKIGLEKGIITKKEYKKIEEAIMKRKKPPMNTALGGDICIHGTKATIGCIAIDKNIKYLYDKVKNYKNIFVTIVRGTKQSYLK